MPLMPHLLPESEEGFDYSLRSATFNCPKCEERLYRVDHAPMCDDYVLYCDSCANRVEVSFYDPIYMALFNELAQRNMVNRTNIMAEVEKLLKPCECGGHYRDDAPRRCPSCQTVVVEGERGVDLELGFSNEEDPTAEDIARYEQFEAQHIRRDDIWKQH